EHLSRGGSQAARDAVERRGFAGAVRPDQRVALPRAHGERHPIDGDDPTERLREVPDLDGSGVARHAVYALPRSARAMPMIPCGAQSTVAMKMAPSRNIHCAT